MPNELLKKLDDFIFVCNSNGKIIYKNHPQLPKMVPLENDWFQYKNHFYRQNYGKFTDKEEDFFFYQFHDETELYQNILSLKTDSTTQIPNRKTINEIILDLDTSNNFYTFAMLDIDHFKIYNDTFGHIYGDQLLAELGSILKLNKEKFDFYGRYGGEEFIFAFKNKTLQDVLPILESLRQQIINHFFNKTKGLTVSIGVSCCFENIPIASQIAKADEALYYVKNNGRNNIAYLDETNAFILLDENYLVK